MKNRNTGRKYSIVTLLKLSCICTLFLFVSTSKATVLGEGSFIVDEVQSLLLNDVGNGYVLYEQDGLLYLAVMLGSQQLVRIIDVHQPENPILVGSYELELAERLRDFKINGNIAYMLTELSISSPFRCSVVLLNVTDPTNPIRVGSSTRENVRTYLVDFSDRICIYKNYTYVSSNELLIFDCSNRTLPVKVANYTSSLGDLYVKNDYLYLVSDDVKIYSLADPMNPVFLGAVNSTKQSTVGSGVYGNYVISAFQESGIQVYNCTDPTQPTICEEYDIPNWQLYIEGNIQDMEIVGDKLFTGGSELYVFDISTPHKLKRLARVNFGDQNISRITVANNYMYLTIDNNIRVYSYLENALGRNLGLGIGIGLPVVVGASLYIRWKKKRA